MSLKNNELYGIYLAYLSTLNLNNSKLRLLEISQNYFEKFSFRYKNDPLFKKKNEKRFLSIIRNKKLNSLIEEYDTKIP
jgi:hypothetical protein